MQLHHGQGKPQKLILIFLKNIFIMFSTGIFALDFDNSSQVVAAF